MEQHDKIASEYPEPETQPEFEVVVSGKSAYRHDSAEKARIRAKYQSPSSKPVVITPAKTPEDRTRGTRQKLRVAAYCRVSTPNEAQISSIEMQKTYFQKYVAQHDDWVLVGIFADEGITATNRKKRDSFNEMIRRCKDGQIDRVVIKDVARYARNVVDSLSVARELRELNPPVGIIFEGLNFNTLQDNYEIFLIMLSVVAQLDSQQKSEVMKWSIRHRFEAGHFLCPTNNLLGYMTVDDQMVIEPEGAKTVRLIYYMFLAGYSANEIADRMTAAKRRTGWLRKDAEGQDIYNTRWSQGSVMNILRNERYCGDVRAQKTFTVSYLTHEKRRNSGEMPSYWQNDHHEGIVTRDVYSLAQKIIASNRFSIRNSKYSLSLSVITEGLLRGFIPLNRTWAGSDLEEYQGVSDTVSWSNSQLRSIRLSSIHQFEVLRAEYATNQTMPTLTFTEKSIYANSFCRTVMDHVEHVEFLLHPRERLLAIRASNPDHNNAVRWVRRQQNNPFPVSFSSGVISKLVFELMNWEPGWKFKAKGQFRKKGNEVILMFSLAETAAYIPIMQMDQYGEDRFIGWNRPIYPFEWHRQLTGPSLINSITCARMHLVDYFGEWNIQSQANKPPEFERKKPLSKAEIQEAIEALDPETL